MPDGNVSLRMHTTSPYRPSVSIFVLMINQVRHLKKHMHHLTKINPKYIECCLNWKTYKEYNTVNVDT